jgi:RNA polymerase sigma factor (TIGR02999 family)
MPHGTETDGRSIVYTKRYMTNYTVLPETYERRGAGNTLNTTALVHEAYIKLIPSQDHDWQDKTHFLRVAARAMRQIIVNAARQRHAYKRGAGEMNFTFNDELYNGKTVSATDIITLDNMLNKLERLNQRQAKIVECRVFVGMNIEETAQDTRY